MNLEVFKKTFYLLDPYSNKFSSLFYKKLLANPELRVYLIKKRIELKEKELMIALIILIDKLKDQNELKKIIKEKIKNIEIYEFLNKYREILREALIETLEYCLKENCTKEVKQVWIYTYNLVIDLILESKKEKSNSSVYSLKGVNSSVSELRLKAIAKKTFAQTYSNNILK